jgi:hypothetical protein
MNDCDYYLTFEEFKQMYPGLASCEMVILRDHEGDRMWQRQKDGWWRLSDEAGGSLCGIAPR